MKVLVLDNYDSFTFNLVQYVQEILGRKVDVYRNDAISLDDVGAYDAIILSPGPGLPSDAGIMPALIRRYAPEKPILGVCLGHQAIGEAFGGSLENLAQVYHGVETAIAVTDAEEPLFRDIPSEFQAGRYHSWAVRSVGLPAGLKVTAVDANGAIMAMSHRQYNVRGVQFHPESIMTAHGRKMLENFFAYCVPAAQEVLKQGQA
ncbi:MAG: aminodeoxychorismate/anthranilate synthase component II [Phaeodactylibacter sp.]|nr:aminodeoxychorismate/anthranilate synthase component II [Phaeodactylibacter sp.]